jgi:hypothetical protein
MHPIALTACTIVWAAVAIVHSVRTIRTSWPVRGERVPVSGWGDFVEPADEKDPKDRPFLGFPLWTPHGTVLLVASGIWRYFAWAGN